MRIIEVIASWQYRQAAGNTKGATGFPVAPQWSLVVSRSSLVS